MVPAWVAQRLRVINWIHAKLELGLIWLPATIAHHDINILRLNDERFKLLELIALPASIALCDSPLARSKPVWHGLPEVLARGDPQRSFLTVLVGSHLPLLIIHLLKHRGALRPIGQLY